MVKLIVASCNFARVPESNLKHFKAYSDIYVNTQQFLFSTTLFCA